MTMNLDHEELHRLLATLAESDIQEFRLEGEDFCLEVKRNLGTSSDLIPSQKKTTIEEIDPPPPPLEGPLFGAWSWHGRWSPQQER